MSTANGFKTFMLLALITGLFVAIGGLLGGPQGMVIALLVAGAMNLFAFWNSDSMVLRMYRAQETSAATHPGFHRLVAELADRAGMPMPKVYIIDEAQPNAFATGRSPERAAVAATTGLLRMLDEREVAGVMAHELAHVKHRDTLIMTVTATIAGAIGMLANFGGMFASSQDNRNPLGLVGGLLLMILAPFAAMLVQMAISRSREYEADRLGAEICGNPLWLASALAKIQNGAARIDNYRAEANPATAHMFIINPLHMQAVDGLFRTHPKTEERIRRLQAMASVGGSGRGGMAAAAPSAAAASRAPVRGRSGSVPSAGRGRSPTRPWG